MALGQAGLLACRRLVCYASSAALHCWSWKTLAGQLGRARLVSAIKALQQKEAPARAAVQCSAAREKTETARSTLHVRERLIERRKCGSSRERSSHLSSMSIGGVSNECECDVTHQLSRDKAPSSFVRSFVRSFCY